VDSEWSLPLDHNVCGAVMGDVGKQLEQELVRNSFGTVKTVLIESNSTTFYMIKDIDGSFVFVADSSANLGSIRMRIDKILANFRNEG
jgi:predicted regulator of Ras-like GTPase activity (Roadblock/LC7/MglB family)